MQLNVRKPETPANRWVDSAEYNKNNLYRVRAFSFKISIKDLTRYQTVFVLSYILTKNCKIMVLSISAQSVKNRYKHFRQFYFFYQFNVRLRRDGCCTISRESLNDLTSLILIIGTHIWTSLHVFKIEET